MATYYWVGGSGTWNNSNTANWSNVTGGSGGFGPPLSTDTVNFDSNSGTGTCTTAATAAASVITINTSTLTVKLGASFTASGTVTLTQGTLDLNNFNFLMQRFISNNTNVRTIAFGTAEIQITGNNSDMWQVQDATNLTMTGNKTVNMTYSGATGTRVFYQASTAGGSINTAINCKVSAGTDTVLVLTHINNLDFTGFSGTLGGNSKTIYGNLTFSTGMTISAAAITITFAGTSGTQQITTNGKTLDFAITFNGIGGTFQFQDALTMGSTRAMNLTNGTLKLKAGTTNTVGSFSTSGTTTKYLASTTPGTQATISDASGTNSVSYLSIQDSIATGGATWQAYLTNNNANAGNNLGWDFALQLGKYMYSRRKNKRILP